MARLTARRSGQAVVRDRIEEADAEFFKRVAQGYHALAQMEPGRIKRIDASGPEPKVESRIWEIVRPLV